MYYTIYNTKNDISQINLPLVLLEDVLCILEFCKENDLDLNAYAKEELLKLGDNVVLQVNSIDDYEVFARKFIRESISEEHKLVYMRFANHKPLVQEFDNIKTYKLDAYSGFEAFTSEIYNIISNEGEEVFYVFDSLSDLLSAWANDLMIGNFFMIVCPYLFELKTIAYFGLLREYHTFETMLRLVFGLGTHAVDRVENDYPRVVSLDKPMLLAMGSKEDIKKYSQHEMDIIDIEKNDWDRVSISKILFECKDINMDLIGIRDFETNKRIRELGIQGHDAYILRGTSGDGAILSLYS